MKHNLTRSLLLSTFLAFTPAFGAASSSSGPEEFVEIPLSDGHSLHELEQRAEKGDKKALAVLGNTYFEGKQVERNVTKAVGYWEKIAQQGDPEMLNTVGLFYLKGLDDLVPNPERAFPYLVGAAETECLQAQKTVGLMYAQGTGTTPDPEKAMQYWMRAANQGDIDSHFDIGQLCNELGDYANAIHHWQYASKNGHLRAQMNMGALFFNGLNGVPKIPEQAFFYWKMAADQDLADAQYKIAVMYFEGNGTDINYEQAAEYFKRAGDQCQTAAQRNLAVMYHKGLTTDHLESIQSYIDYARKNTDEEFAQMLEDLIAPTAPTPAPSPETVVADLD